LVRVWFIQGSIKTFGLYRVQLRLWLEFGLYRVVVRVWFIQGSIETLVYTGFS
jgi:hypothetical protein